MTTRALITGVTGQDGWYLARRLNARGLAVFGLVTANDEQPLPPGVQRLTGDLRDAGSIAAALEESGADLVVNLAAVSSVAASWEDPVLVAEVTAVGVARLLAAVRDRAAGGAAPARVVHASSAEIFGDAPAPQHEGTPVAPTNPYGAAKAYAQYVAAQFRLQGLPVSTAILFPHESPRRPDRFVSRKITKAVAGIALGSSEPLVLGNLDARRDWGHADDVARALELIGEAPEPADYVVATGESHSIRDFVRTAFAHVGIDDWESRVEVSAEFVRPTDAAELRGDASRLRDRLGWSPAISFEEMVAAMVDHDLELLRSTR